MLSLRLPLRILFLCIPLLGAQLHLTAQIPTELRGQVTDAASGLPIQGAVVTLDMNTPDGTPEYSATTGPFGFYTITGIASGDYTAKATHRVFQDKTAPDPLIVGTGQNLKQNFKLSLLAQFPSVDSFFDIYVQVNGAISGWGLTNCPVVIERYENMGDASPADSFLLFTDENGATVLNGAEEGYYRFVINNHDDAGSRDKWEEFTTEGKTDDKKHIAQPYMAQLYLKPVEQEMTFRVVEPTHLDVTDLFNFIDDVLMKGVYVTLEGFDPDNPDIQVIPPRTGVTDENGQVTFKGLPGVRYVVTPKRLGYTGIEKIIEPDAEGTLPTELQTLDLYYQDRSLQVNYIHNYNENFHAHSFGNKLVGIKGTNTEGIERTFILGFPGLPDGTATYQYLLPGRYRVVATGEAFGEVEMLTAHDQMLTESFAAQAIGEIVVEISDLGQTEVDMPIEFKPVRIRGRLMAADRKAEPENEPAYLPVANKTVRFKEKEGVDILPDGMKEVAVTTDASGAFNITILPGIYGIVVDGMDEYWGEAVIETPIASSSLSLVGLLGEAERKVWPMWQQWPYPDLNEFAIDQVFDPTGMPFGGNEVTDLELLLRKDVVQVRMPIQIVGNPDITYDPTEFLVPGFNGDEQLLTVDYRDIVETGIPMLTPVGGGTPINGSVAKDTETDVQALWEDVPPGDYNLSVSHDRFVTNSPQPISIFDYPAPGMAPSQPYDSYPYTGASSYSAPLNQINTEEVTSEFPNITEATINVHYWNSSEDDYDPVVELPVRLLKFGYVPGVFAYGGTGPAPYSWTEGWVFANGGWIHVTPGSTINVGKGESPDTPPDGPPSITSNYTVEARLKNDPTRTVDGVHFQVYGNNGDPLSLVTPYNNGSFNGSPGSSQPFGLDNWIWDGFHFPVVDLSGGTINIKETIIVDQGMEVVVTVRNATTLSVLQNVPVELLASNGVPLRDFNSLAGKQEFLTDETGKVTFNSVPGYRDYFVSIEAPGFRPLLHRLNAADATEVMGDPSTNFRHTVTLDLTLLTPPNITTTGVPIDRYGAFLPGVNKSGGQDAFQLTAEDTLTATWSVRFGRQTHIYQLPGFDQADGSTGDPRDVTMEDDIVEVWLVDQRVFEGDFYSNDPTSLNLPPATDPIGVAQALADIFKQPNFDETKKFTYFSRTTDIQAFDEEFGLYEATGKIKLWKLPPGEFDPVIIVVAKSGAIALYDVPYTGDDDGKQLLGVPIPPWLSFAFDIIGFTGGVSTTQDEIKKYVPDGKFIPFPEFSAEIKRHKEDDQDTNYVDYEYKITLLQKEGQDMPGRDLTGLAAGILGGEFKSEAAITMPGMDKKLALSIESTISNEDIDLENYAPKLAGGLKVEASLDKVSGSVKTENAVNVDPNAPWEVRLENTVNFNMDASFKMNLEPVLGKIPYVGPVLTVLDKTGTLTFTAVTEAGAGLGTTFCWETLRPQDINFGTTTDPDPRVRRRHFLGGHEPDAPTGCTNSFNLCFRFGVGMDVEADLRIGSLEGNGRLLLTGPECAGESALTITPNTFGDWPPVKRIAGEAKAEIKGTVKTPIKNFSKEWSWSLLKFDAQYGTETVFQLIPMEIAQEVMDLTIIPNPNFNGDTVSPDIVKDFLPVGTFEASPGGRVLFLGKNESTGDIQLLMAKETGPFQYDTPIEIASAGAIDKPQLLELPDGRVLIVWVQIDSADIDDVFAPADLMFSISDTSGSNFSSAALIASLNSIPQGMRLRQSGGLIALVLLQEAGGSMQLTASSYSGTSWSTFESFGSPEEITAFDVAATGPDGPSEVHIHYIIDGNLRYYRWVGGTPASSLSISLGTVDPWTGNLSSQATSDGIYRVTGNRENSGLNYYSAPAPGSSYSMASGFALDAKPTQFQSTYIDDDTNPVIVYVWTESTQNGVALRFAFTDSSGNTLTASQLLTGGVNGRYSDIRIVPLGNGTARIFAVFTNVPRDGFSPLGVSEPNDSSELRTFLVNLGSGTSGNDTDDDGMDDTKELDIVDYDPDDSIASVADVLPNDDFDDDGYTNLAEIDMGTDPTDPLSFPLLDGVIVNATEPVAHEYGSLPGTITVRRPADDLSQPLSVLYSVGGTATPGDDYNALTSPIEIATDSDSAMLMVSPVADDEPEGDETVEVTLQEDAAYVLSEPSSATVTIKDRPIDDWRWRNFPTNFDQPEAQDLSDSENDGILNILEYALALDPGVPDNINLPMLSIYDNINDGKQYLMITYTRSKDATDLDYIVEVAGDLSSGIWLSGGGEVVDISMGETDGFGNDIIKVRDTVPLDDNGTITRFMRLRVLRHVEMLDEN